jgi:hypothetical protein
MIDFKGRYHEWAAKEARGKEKSGGIELERRRGKRAAPANREPAKKKENPYLRPFGRLSLEELERQITDTEIAISESQQGFADAESLKEPARGQKLHAEYEELSKKLEALEAEYFAREQ